ncbi:MAG: asparagine synthase (glutamine-hydrolyzing), partial [Candidatus Omnitrophica bacterium]|nr:asparagine synthase (glutamine-hydrolyzing) [Candidatus Omnitrophota bacterium]
MCGIAGYIGRKHVNRSNKVKTLALMANRGPDANGQSSFENGGVYVDLLHTRLSIIDLDKRADQPMSIDGVSIIFNGEIYNYVEIRDQLKSEGIVFATESDTEVLLRAYLKYGKSCVNRFEGMWSFAIYDIKKRELFLSRDRFGEKPLYIYREADGIFFASEIKFLKALSGVNFEINRKHICRYLVNGYKSLAKTEGTFFSGIEEFPRSANMLIGLDIAPKLTTYWAPVFAPRDMSMAAAIEKIRYLLFKSIKLRLRSDVPLAFCLSGGVDSAAIASIAAKCFKYDVATFSIIDKDERYNEYGNIRATIDDLNCEHTIIHTGEENFLPRMKSLVGYHDAPVATMSYYVH